MQQEAEQHGISTDYVYVSQLNVQPCTGCMKCRNALHCCLPEDDAHKVLALLGEADVLVVGAPCYWGNMPGQLKMLFDRMVYGMMGENRRGLPVALHKGKGAVIVTTCTTPWPFNVWFNQSRGTVKALREILKWSGFRIKAVIEKAGTKHNPCLTEKEINRCRRTIRKLFVD